MHVGGLCQAMKDEPALIACVILCLLRTAGLWRNADKPGQLAAEWTEDWEGGSSIVFLYDGSWSADRLDHLSKWQRRPLTHFKGLNVTNGFRNINCNATPRFGNPTFLVKVANMILKTTGREHLSLDDLLTAPGHTVVKLISDLPVSISAKKRQGPRVKVSVKVSLQVWQCLLGHSDMCFSSCWPLHLNEGAKSVRVLFNEGIILQRAWKHRECRGGNSS